MGALATSKPFELAVSVLHGFVGLPTSLRLWWLDFFAEEIDLFHVVTPFRGYDGFGIL
jgi:hypothetical protein